MKVILSQKLFVVIIIAAASCKPNCERSIDIFEGANFNKGQKYTLTIGDAELERSENFWTSMSRGKYKKVAGYCCKKDSVKVKFTLDNSDTVFYISAEKTKRLLVGSYFDGTILVATDENPDAWIKM